MLINFVGKHHHLWIFSKHSGKGAKFGFAIHATGRVAWRTENHKFGFWSDGSVELFRCNLEVLRHSGRHFHTLTASKNHHLNVAHPCWSGNHHLVARVHNTHHHVGKFVLSTVTNHDLLWSKIHTILFLQFFADSLTQRQVAWHRRIETKVVVDSLFSRHLDMVGSGEVGFAHRKINHINTLSLKLLTFLRHCQCG